LEVTYALEYFASVVERDIPALPKAARAQIRAASEHKLAEHPVQFGKPLRFSLKGVRRLRVGDYRVLFVLEGNTVVIVKIGHRREVYER
jgi:mRNA interferase RelE/StbE